jgi:hypothetical protein
MDTLRAQGMAHVIQALLSMGDPKNQCPNYLRVSFIVSSVFTCADFDSGGTDHDDEMDMDADDEYGSDFEMTAEELK